MGPDLKVTPASEWRKESEGVLYQLPSGRVARLRGVGFDLLVMVGRIPDTLTAMVADLMEGKENTAVTPKTLNELRQNVDFLNAIAQCAMVEPRVVEHPTQPDEIGVYDLLLSDKQFLMNLLGVATRDLERFRHEQEGAVDGVVSPEGHGDTGEPDAAGAGVGDSEDGAGRLVDSDPV
jgi:hypothetical protein